MNLFFLTFVLVGARRLPFFFPPSVARVDNIFAQMNDFERTGGEMEVTVSRLWREFYFQSRFKFKAQRSLLLRENWDNSDDSDSCLPDCSWTPYRKLCAPKKDLKQWYNTHPDQDPENRRSNADNSFLRFLFLHYEKELTSVEELDATKQILRVKLNDWWKTLSRQSAQGRLNVR